MPKPTTRQYTANQINLPFLTKFSIQLHARKPEIKAAKKPTVSDNIEIPLSPCVKLPFIKSRKAYPKIGTSTIRKENLATFSLLFPKRIPVAIVDPERDNPGNTAQAWAIPITKASRKEIVVFARGRA